MYVDLRVFWSIAYVHIPEKERTKLDDKSEKFLFIGYDFNSKGYKLSNPSILEDSSTSLRSPFSLYTLNPWDSPMAADPRVVASLKLRLLSPKRGCSWTPSAYTPSMADADWGHSNRIARLATSALERASIQLAGEWEMPCRCREGSYQRWVFSSSRRPTTAEDSLTRRSTKTGLTDAEHRLLTWSWKTKP